MSKLRPELETRNDRTALLDSLALDWIARAVAKRRMLIHGKLEDQEGHFCALGAFWHDNPGAAIHSALVDEVAAINDSVPANASPRERWRIVNRWLKLKRKSQ